MNPRDHSHVKNKDVKQKGGSYDVNNTKPNACKDTRYSLANDMKIWGAIASLKSGLDADDIAQFINLLDVLGLIGKEFEYLSSRLSRLQEELDCLDDGATNNLSGWTGELHDSVRRARQACESCGTILCKASEWRQALQPKLKVFSTQFDSAGLAEFLHKALMDNERLQDLCFDLVEQRWAAVDRAKATIEAGDVECQASATALLKRALEPSRRIDFPMITEICERLTARPLEIKAATSFLMSVINGCDMGSNRQLKALTIMHEMLHDEHVKRVFCESEGFEAALWRLQVEHFGPSPEGLIAENIRMLASEISHRCFAASSAQSVKDAARLSKTCKISTRKSALDSVALFLCF